MGDSWLIWCPRICSAQQSPNPFSKIPLQDYVIQLTKGVSASTKPLNTLNMVLILFRLRYMDNEFCFLYNLLTNKNLNSYLLARYIGLTNCKILCFQCNPRIVEISNFGVVMKKVVVILCFLILGGCSSFKVAKLILNQDIYQVEIKQQLL